jgi:hypothetical protein
LAKGQLDRAIVEYEQVVALDPKDPRSLLKLGDLYTRVGETKKAVATYRKVALQYGDEGFFLKPSRFTSRSSSSSRATSTRGRSSARCTRR